MSKSIQQSYKLYGRRLLGAMVSYTVLLIMVSLLVNISSWPMQLNILLAVVPILPIMYGVWVYRLFLENIDELQQMIQMKAIVTAAGLTGILTTAYGFLQAFASFPPINLTWIFPLMIMFWGVGQLYYGRAYV
jgi:hypothetical protein